MSDKRFADWKQVPVRALLVGERINVRALEKGPHLDVAPLTLNAGTDGVAVVLRYGAVILFNMQAMEQAAFLEGLKSMVTGPVDDNEAEETEILVTASGTERVDSEGAIHLRHLTLEHLELVAEILGKSVVLAYYERRVAEVFDSIEPLAAGLGRPGRGRAPMNQLLRQIGDVLLMQHRMVGRVEVDEKPDLLWDTPELERLYARLADEYELTDRAAALERKLAVISQTAATSLELLNNRRSLRVEWYIVILIVIEILLTLLDLFVLKH